MGSQTLSYDVNDRLTTNTYDANGNTLAAGARTFVYDSMDRLTKFNSGAVTMVYDGDGTRVAKTSGGVTTQYLVDDLNPTGLPQVAEEVVGGAVARRYTYGINRISQTQAGVTSMYDYDAHGDVRALMSTAPVAPGNFATPTDTYEYDAFGNLIGSTGTTSNVYRYQGEALDEETGLYYFRARYYDPVAGRFLTIDPLAAQGEHPYEYAGADPVNGHDPTGQQDVEEESLIVGSIVLPYQAELVGIEASIKCLWGLTSSMLANASGDIVRIGACQMGAARGTGTAPAPKPPGTSGGSGKCTHGFDTRAFAEKIDSLTAGNTWSTTGYPGHKNAQGTYCAWYVHAALVAAGANVPSGNAFTFAASLPSAGFEQIASYPAPNRSMLSIPGSQQGDITVFGKASTHHYGHIEGYDGVHWTSYWQQSMWYPYGINADKKGPAGPAVVFRTKCPCGQ